MSYFWQTLKTLSNNHSFLKGVIKIDVLDKSQVYERMNELHKQHWLNINQVETLGSSTVSEPEYNYVVYI